MRRVFSALILTWMLANALIFVPSASAASAESAAAATLAAPATTAALSVSTTTPCQGQSIQAGGADFGANEAVHLTIGSRHVSVASTNFAGAFDWVVTTPELVGPQTLAGVGEMSRHRASLTLTIRPCRSPGVDGESVVGGPLSSTSAKVIGLCAIVAFLAGAGAFAYTATRRREPAAPA